MTANSDLIEPVPTGSENWSLVIRPQRNLFDLRLGELWKYRDLTGLFVRRDFVSVYKQTILGPLWFLIQPILTTITFTVIFGRIAKMPTDGLPQFLFYMSGTVVWTYFSDCLNKTSNTFITNSQLFGKVYFPRLTVPISILISTLIAFIYPVYPVSRIYAVFLAERRGYQTQRVGAFYAGAIGDDGRAGVGFRDHCLIAHHALPRSTLPGYFRRTVVDVCHTGHLSCIVDPRTVPDADQGQSNHPDR